jgi:ribosomal protein S18 acetylase RimI-like enzyme
VSGAPTSPSLRPAEPDDAEALAELAQAAYAHYVDRVGGRPRPMDDDYADVIRRHEVTVAERGGEIAGMVVLVATEEGLALDNVAVAPSHQGAGVGRALLAQAEAAARELGYDSIYLYTHELMTENQALYERIGYAEYDRRVHGAATLVYMRKPL